MSHSYVIEPIVPQNSNFAKLFCVFFIIFSFSYLFLIKTAHLHDFRCILRCYFCLISIIFTFYFLYAIHKTIVPIAYFRSLVDHYALSITNKKEHSIKYLIYEMFFFIFNSNLQSYRSHLSQHLCFCDYLSSFVIIRFFLLLFFYTDLPEWSPCIGTFFALSDHFLKRPRLGSSCPASDIGDLYFIFADHSC